jgi:hypothetical protein
MSFLIRLTRTPAQVPYPDATTMITQPTWPASQTFWRDKRVIVTGPSATLRTGGSGFLGACAQARQWQRLRNLA